MTIPILSLILKKLLDAQRNRLETDDNVVGFVAVYTRRWLLTHCLYLLAEVVMLGSGGPQQP
jgi:hypothetical protein